MKRKRISRQLRIEQVEKRLPLARPAVTISNAEIVEGDSGEKVVNLVVNLSEPPDSSVIVKYKTRDGSAKAGIDYEKTKGKLNFRSGEVSKTIQITIHGDLNVEDEEEFYVLLTSAKRAELAADRATVTIHDNDQPVPEPPDPPTDDFGATGLLGQVSGVSAPSGATLLSPTQSASEIESLVKNAGSNAVFFFTPGTYRDLSISPRSGQQFIGAPGAVLTSDTESFAFRSNNEDVTIRNLIIDGYRPQWPAATVVTGHHWTLDHLEIRNSPTIGVALHTGSTLTNSYIHHNAQLGLKAEGADIVVLNNEVAFNHLDSEFDVDWEAGGSKFFDTSNVLVERNTFHDNVGKGIWFDYNNRAGIVRFNHSYNHTLSGIFQEIGGSLLIESNLVENNGVGYTDDGWLQGAGICIEASHDVIVRNNIVRNNANGITVIATDRNEFVARNITIEHNTIIMNRGRTGVVWDYEAVSVPWDTVFFDYNTYDLNGDAGFAWEAPYTDVIRTWSQWRSAGNDPHGTLL